MKYDKNKWLSKSEFRKTEGFTFINLEGKVIKEGCTLRNIKFVDFPDKHIIIHGYYSILQSGVELQDLDFVEETIKLYNNLIVGQRINYVKFDRRKNLEISIDCHPVLLIRVDIDSDSFEKWQYSYKGGCLVFS